VHDFKVGDLVIEIPARARRHARKPLVGVVTELRRNVILKVQFTSGRVELAAFTSVDKLSRSNR
jgi:hypothetical protein